MSAARRAAPTLLAALLVLLTLVSPAAAGVSPSPSGTATPNGTATPDAGADPVRVQVTQITPTVLRPGDDLVVRARLTNTTDEEISGVRARVRLERIRPGTRAELDAWLEPATTDTRARIGTTVATVALDEPLAPGASADVEAQVAAADVGLLDRPDTWGARGLAVEATGARNARLGLQRTFALWATEGDVTQARVSVLAPVVGPAPTPTDSDVSPPGPELGELVRTGGRLAAVLDLARRHPDVALAVDPALVADAREEDGPAGAWAEALVAASVGRDVVALPWSDPDLAALANPETHVSPAAPPFVIQHGVPDRIVPCRQSVRFAEKLRAAIGEDKVRLTLFDDYIHADRRFETMHNCSLVLDQLEELLRSRRVQTTGHE